MNYISYTNESVGNDCNFIMFSTNTEYGWYKTINDEIKPNLQKLKYEDTGFTSLPLSEDFHKALLEYFESGNEGISRKKLLKMYKETRDYKAKDLVKIERKEQKRRMKFDQFFHEQRMRFPFHFCTDETQVCINSNKVPKGVYVVDECWGEYQSTSYTLISDDKEKLVKYITKCFKGDALNESLEFAGLK